MATSSWLYKLFAFNFVKYIAALLAIVLTTSLTIVLVTAPKQQDNSKLTLQSIDQNQQKNLLKTLQQFSNAYVFMGETDMNLDWLPSEFDQKLELNLKHLTKIPSIFPLNFVYLKRQYIEQLRHQFAKRDSNLKKTVKTRDIEEYLQIRNSVTNFLALFDNLIEQIRGNNTEFLDLFFRGLIINDQFNDVTFQQIKNIYQALSSQDVLKILKNLQKWLSQNYYAKILLTFSDLFRMKPYKDNLVGKVKNLVNFFILFDQILKLKPDEVFNQFLQKHFLGETNIKSIIKRLIGDKTYAQQIETKMQSINIANRLNQQLRRHIFRMVGLTFVQKFVGQLFFNPRKPSALLSVRNINQLKTTQIVQTLLENEGIDTFLQLFNLLFFDHLIVNNVSIPETFRDFIQTYVRFIKDFDFTSRAAGYLIGSLEQGLQKQFSCSKKLSLEDCQQSIVETALIQIAPEVLHDSRMFRDSLRSWINSAQTANDQFFPQKDQTIIHYCQKSVSLTKLKASLSSEPLDKDCLLNLFTTLLSKTPIYLTFISTLEIDKENLLIRFGTNLLSQYLQKTKTNFLKKNDSSLNLLQFLFGNVPLDKFDISESFTLQKQQKEIELRDAFNRELIAFINAIENSADNSVSFAFLENTLSTLYSWLDFLWQNLLIKFEFLSFNFILVAIANTIFANSKVGKFVVQFASFGKNTVLFPFLLQFLKFSQLFFQTIDQLQIDWNEDKMQRNDFLKLINKLGFQENIQSKIDQIFIKDSLFDRFFNLFQDRTTLSNNEQQFLFFIQNILLGEGGFLSFILSQISQYLNNAFYTFLDSNNWNYSQVQFSNWANWLSATNNQPLIVTYVGILKSDQFNDVQYRFVWSIPPNNTQKEAELAKIERIWRKK